MRLVKEVRDSLPGTSFIIKQGGTQGRFRTLIRQSPPYTLMPVVIIGRAVMRLLMIIIRVILDRFLVQLFKVLQPLRAYNIHNATGEGSPGLAPGCQLYNTTRLRLQGRFRVLDKPTTSITTDASTDYWTSGDVIIEYITRK